MTGPYRSQERPEQARLPLSERLAYLALWAMGCGMIVLLAYYVMAWMRRAPAPDPATPETRCTSACEAMSLDLVFVWTDEDLHAAEPTSGFVCLCGNPYSVVEISSGSTGITATNLRPPQR